MKSIVPILFALVVLVFLMGCTRSQTESSASKSRASGSAPPDSVTTFRDDMSFLRQPDRQLYIRNRVVEPV